MSIINTLKNCELFGGLETGHLQKLSVLCRGNSYQRGRIIFNEGDEATELYILTDGQVVLEMQVCPVPNRPAIPTAVEVVSKDECFGWSAVVEPYVSTLSARCMTNCTVLAIKGDMLRGVMLGDPVLGWEVMKKLAQLIASRLTHTRLRLINGLGLIMLGKELEISE